MNRMLSRLIYTGVATGGILTLSAAPALAHQCVNLNKPAGAGARLIVSGENLIFNSPGLERQFTKDPVRTEEKFRGIIGIDVDGDEKADFSTYIVGKEYQIPLSAQQNGSPDHGISTLP